MRLFVKYLSLLLLTQALWAEVHVIEIKPDSKASLVDKVDDHQGTLLISGGYFDIHKNPVGYFKKNGIVNNAKVDNKLSGFVTISKDGKIKLVTNTKSGKAPQAHNVFQSGPFVIDKGGKIGIKKSVNKRFSRICLLQGKSGWQKVIYYKSIDLYDLAHFIKRSYPDIDMALNLDGGPSCHLQTKTLSIQTTSSMPYFISIR